MNCSQRDDHRRLRLIGAGLLAGLAFASQAQEAGGGDDSGWFLRAWGGYSNLSDTSGSAEGLLNLPPTTGVDVSTSGGFAAGGGIGYRYGPRLAAEIAWEYRSNDSETTFGDGTRFSEGNYASNTIFLNGFYFLGERGAWEPYVGAGLAWIQEIDIDLEGNGPELSYSGDGDLGFHVFAGTKYRLGSGWSAHAELRYGSMTGIDLSGEGTDGRITGLDYQPVTLQLGLDYQF